MSDTVILTETQQERALRTGAATPRFLQGVFPFVGRGLFDLAPLDDSLIYTVPDGKKTQFVYFRAGNACDALVYFAVAVNGTPIRYFPVGPNADIHVVLAIMEPHAASETMSILIAAPRGATGTMIVDAGLVESAQ